MRLKTKLTPESCADIARLYAEGWTQKRLIQTYHIPVQRVKQCVLDAGGTLRLYRKNLMRLSVSDVFAASTREINPQCCYCGLRLDLVRTIHETDNGRCCDMCYHHVNKLRREPQGQAFWSDVELAGMATY